MTKPSAIPVIIGSEAGRERLMRTRRRSLRAPELPEPALSELRERFGGDATPVSAVRQILTDVEERGDAALEHWSQALDDCSPDPLSLGPERMQEAYDRLDPELRGSLERARDRIREFHQAEPVPDWSIKTMGGRLGQRLTPIQRVGIYVPGGSAPLPSSLLMSAVPARIAGVPELIVATPPPAPAIILAAAHLSDVTTVVQVGGAQAVGALAFGTETVPAVDKVVGAGGLFVTLAKREVFGVIGIDGLFGPTETLIIADETADPEWLAADLLAQAEHDPLATAVLLVTEEELATSTQAAAERQLEHLDRREIILSSLDGQGGIIVVDEVQDALRLSNEFGPEHLCLSVRDPAGLVDNVTNAGGVFLGERSGEVLGDYVAGPSHVMPTGGSARFAGPLSVRDFVKASSVIGLDESTARDLAPDAIRLARAEGLTAHAAAAELRMEFDDV